MQSVLVIDTTCEPALAQLVEVTGRDCRVIEQVQHSFANAFSRECFFTYAHARAMAAENNNTPPPAAAVNAQLSDNSSQADGEVQIPTLPAHEMLISPASAALKELLSTFEGKWSNAILVVPPVDYLPLNVELPFGDPKSIARVLDLEVQDRVPFELDGFVVEHRVLTPLGDRGFDIHVGVIPNGYMEYVTQVCRGTQFEPLIITTPGGVLGALYHVAPEFAAGDSAVIFADPQFVYVTAQVDGITRMVRVIPLQSQGLTGSAEEPARQSIGSEIKLTILWLEGRYRRAIKEIFLLGEELSDSELNQAIGKQVKKIKISELLRGDDLPETSVAALGAIFAQEEDAPQIISNFRVRQYSYNPRLRELLAAAKRVAPYLGATLLVVILSLSLLYYQRARYLSNSYDIIHDQLVALIPDAQIPPGGELRVLQEKTTELRDQLKDLGSLGKLSPLSAFIELTKDFPDSKEVTIRSILIQKSKIELQGSAENFTALVRLEQNLKAKRDTYSRVERQTGNGSSMNGGGRDFKLEIIMSER